MSVKFEVLYIRNSVDLVGFYMLNNDRGEPGREIEANVHALSE